MVRYALHYLFVKLLSTMSMCELVGPQMSIQHLGQYCALSPDDNGGLASVWRGSLNAPAVFVVVHDNSISEHISAGPEICWTSAVGKCM
jgi:hypothetical protein